MQKSSASLWSMYARASMLAVVCLWTYALATAACPQGCLETSSACMGTCQEYTYNGIVLASESLHDPGADASAQAMGSSAGKRYDWECDICSCAAGCAYPCLGTHVECHTYEEGEWANYTDYCEGP